jgi:hypothetical protein
VTAEGIAQLRAAIWPENDATPGEESVLEAVVLRRRAELQAGTEIRGPTLGRILVHVERAAGGPPSPGSSPASWSAR